ncbi:MAG: C1 family peptidase [Leptonema sp. (in: bacteria)]
MKNLKLHSISIGIFIVLLSAYILQTQERFDPKSVQSPECLEGKLKCGLNPELPEQTEAVPVAESTMISHRGLPPKYDFSKDMPPVVNQGRQNSCVAFSTGYYTKSYYEYKENKWKYDSPPYGGQGEHVFSPAYIYNQINGGRDNGSYFHDALNLVVNKGVAPWKYMPYKENDYLTQPSVSVHNMAQKYKAKSFKRIPFDNLNAIKAELAQGNPIIFGMVIDDNFYQLKSDVYDTPGGKQYGGHAMTLVGYDDNKRSPLGHIGAFKLINSWGTSWGDKGYGWISYKTWMQLRPYVYVLDDEKSDSVVESTEMENQVEQEQNPYLPSPGNITATKGTYSDKIMITWNSVSGATVYAILRLAPNGSEFTILGYAYNNFYEDKAVTPNTSYKYAVIAMNDQITSDPEKTKIVTGYTSSQNNNIVDVPKVYDLRAEYRNEQIYITWSEVPSATKYQIRRWDKSKNQWLTWREPISQNQFIDTRPLKDQENRYSVRARINNQYGEWSDPISVNVPGNSTPPPAPRIIDVSKGLYKNKIIIKWELVPDAIEYYVFRYDYSSKIWEGPFRTSISKTSSDTYIDNDPKIMNGKWFAYTVVARNNAGNSDYSNIVLGNTNPNVHRAGEVLPPPKNVRGNLKDKTVTLKWDKVEGSNEYYIYQKKKGEKEYKFIESLPANRLEYTGAFPGKEGDIFFYIVRSKPDMGRESENSNPVAIFMDPKIEIVSHRFMPGQGIEKFIGSWKGSFWGGGSEIENYILKISNQEDTMIVSLEKNQKKQEFTAKYPAMSDVVRFSDFELEYKQEFDLLMFKGKSDTFKGKVITFTK